jgi:hypothetical protein
MTDEVLLKKVIVLTRKGAYITLPEWQKLYGLPVGSEKISKYFSLSEYRFKKDIEQFGQLVVNELLMRVLDRYRERKKAPVNINSFNRDQAKQDELKKEGYRTAITSPHVVKMAVDIDTPGIEDAGSWAKAQEINHQQVKLVKQAADELDIKIRIGNKQYLNEGQTFIHIDVCPEFYAPGMPFHGSNHPFVWERTITW